MSAEDLVRAKKNSKRRNIEVRYTGNVSKSDDFPYGSFSDVLYQLASELTDVKEKTHDAQCQTEQQ